ncbi:MAG TPA: glucose 1-dehydrogenase [Casimicrobiaceae bacterium]|nr:glucose 1-dehydrogenase [Casimicrobiaceae bacterium]HTT41285.1 glucose 1-dehydrogenase [Burkholderiales bacterium]
MGRLDGCITLITGSGRGIGRAMALRYAREGATVAVADIEEASARGVAEEIAALRGRADAFRVDVRDPEQSAAMVGRVVDRYGRLDVLINNAGVMRVKPLLELTPEDWDFVNDVNARGLFFALQAGARQMVKQAPAGEGRPRGKIINVASIAGRIGRPMFASYGASKAAAISITQSAAGALAPDVTVNAICPGVVETEMWRLIDREWTQLDQRPPGSAWQDRIRGIPMGRPETAEDLTGMAVFLASADSDYITGQSYHVDGGLLMH